MLYYVLFFGADSVATTKIFGDESGRFATDCLISGPDLVAARVRLLLATTAVEFWRLPLRQMPATTAGIRIRPDTYWVVWRAIDVEPHFLCSGHIIQRPLRLSCRCASHALSPGCGCCGLSPAMAKVHAQFS